MKTFEQVKPILKNFIKRNAKTINSLSTQGKLSNLEDVLDLLQFDGTIGPEESNIIAFYFIAYFAKRPLEWMNFSDPDLLKSYGDFEIFLYEPGSQKTNGWSGEFKQTNIKSPSQLLLGTWIREIHYPVSIEKVLLDAKLVKS